MRRTFDGDAEVEIAATVVEVDVNDVDVDGTVTVTQGLADTKESMTMTHGSIAPPNDTDPVCNSGTSAVRSAMNSLGTPGLFKTLINMG